MPKLFSLPTTRESLLVAMLTLLPACTYPAEAARSLVDCQGISDAGARLQCYDSLATPVRGASAPVVSERAAATRSTIPAALPAPVPSQTAAEPSREPLAPESALATPARAARTAPVETPAQERSLFKRLIPFGWGDDDADQGSEPVEIKADEPAPLVAGSSAENFGRQSAAEQMNRDGVTELVDTIDKLSYYQPNHWQISLSGGQIWRQQINKAYPLEKGDRIRIRPSGWGDSYRLYSDKVGGFIQVERIDD